MISENGRFNNLLKKRFQNFFFKKFSISNQLFKHFFHIIKIFNPNYQIKNLAYTGVCSDESYGFFFFRIFLIIVKEIFLSWFIWAKDFRRFIPTPHRFFVTAFGLTLLDLSYKIRTNRETGGWSIELFILKCLKQCC